MLKRTCIIIVIAAALLPGFAQASGVDGIYSFGDSLSDVGNIYALAGIPAAPYANGQYSNGNIWVQDLAANLGLPALTASQLGGTDYAYGGAVTSVSSLSTDPAFAELVGPTGQIAQFLSTHPAADPNSLYTVWIGVNNVRAIVETGVTPSQAAIDIALAAGDIDTAITALADAGAKNFLLLTVPDLGLAPELQALGSAASAEASSLSAQLNATLVNGAGTIPSLSSLATTDSLNISVLDTYSLLDSIAANPSLNGLTNVTAPCYTGTYQGFANTSDPGTVCANPNQYAFWDTLHPTAKTDTLIANAAFDAVTDTPEPASGLLLSCGLLGLCIFSTRQCKNRKLRSKA